MVVPHSALAKFPFPHPLLLLPQSVEESPLPRPLSTAPLRATALVAGSDASCLAGVGADAVVALVLTIYEIE